MALSLVLIFIVLYAQTVEKLSNLTVNNLLFFHNHCFPCVRSLADIKKGIFDKFAVITKVNSYFPFLKIYRVSRLQKGDLMVKSTTSANEILSNYHNFCKQSSTHCYQCFYAAA